MSMITRYLDELAIIKAEQDEEAERIALKYMINEKEKVKKLKKVKKSGNTKKNSSNYKGAESR